MKIYIANFEKHLGNVIEQLGVFTGEMSHEEAGREFFNRFYSNLVSMSNHFDLKDVLAASLLQRYNHEISVDFWYVLADDGESDKLKKFFSYNSNDKSRQWSSLQFADRRKYVPEEIFELKSLKDGYRKLCDGSHSNIYSMQLNRKGEKFEYLMITNAVVLVTLEIAACLENPQLKKLFPDVDWKKIKEDNKKFFEPMRELLQQR